VWSHVRIPDVTSLPREVYREAVKIFNEVAKSTNDSQPLYQRIISKSELQKKIDKLALKMMDLNWSDKQLNKLYEVLNEELRVMQNILKMSEKTRRKASGKNVEDEENKTKNRSLMEWVEKDPPTKS
jgi:hypothetical protein